jgi:hypothetical protein
LVSTFFSCCVCVCLGSCDFAKLTYYPGWFLFCFILKILWNFFLHSHSHYSFFFFPIHVFIHSFIFLSLLGFEFRAFHFLNRHSTTWVTPLALLLLGIFDVGSLIFLLGHSWATILLISTSWERGLQLWATETGQSIFLDVFFLPCCRD